MVGFVRSSSANKEEEKRRDSIEHELKNSDDSFCFSLPEIYDFCLPLTDSFVDFDPIKEWLEEDPPIGPPPYSMDEMGSDGFCAEVCPVIDEALGFPEQEKSNEIKAENGCEEVVVVKECCPTGEGVMVGSLVDFVLENGHTGSVEKTSEESIEEELRRVSLNPELNDSSMVGVDGGKIKNGGLVVEEPVDNGVKQSTQILNVDADVGGKNEMKRDKDDSLSESESESESESLGSSTSSSDTSSDEDDEEKKENIAGGETEVMAFKAEEMVSWSDAEDDEDDATKGPIRSKNEITDLPTVPAVNVSLLPHHHALPVGIISSIMGYQVIVEGVEKHNPLSEGSIVWITESRSPLGLVDEIFGPVKNPYYIVRYNSETEVPAGLQQGTQISFVPEFADHVLNNTYLYRKGYDASGENDEELSEEAEFSDDEKEAEYRRMQKMKKRGTNDDKGDNRKKDIRNSKNRLGVRKHEQSAAKQTHDLSNNVSTQHLPHPTGVSSGTRPNFSSGLMPSHHLPQLGVAPGSTATTSSNVWLNGNLSQATEGTGFPNNPQMQGMPWLQGNHPQPVVQAPFLNVAPFQQNLHMNPSFPSNLATVAGQPNYGSRPAFAPWPCAFSPNFFNQTLFGMGMQDQNAPTATNIGANVSYSGLQHGSLAQNVFNQSILGMGMQGHNPSTTTYVCANTVEPNRFQQSANFNPGQDTFQNFNSRNNRGGGRRPYHRGGGRFRGGRGRRPS